jgi:hypothetical protein
MRFQKRVLSRQRRRHDITDATIETQHARKIDQRAARILSSDDMM